MSISRRDFLRGSACAVAAGAAASSVLLPADAAQPDQARRSPADRKLVLIELSGGNDSLNTVIPIRDGAYAMARPTLAIRPDQALALDRDTALHPSMTGLRDLFARGELAIVRGVGYPNPSRSHFRSMEIWHRADTAEFAEGAASGWIARSCRQMGAMAPMPLAYLGQYVPEAFSGIGSLAEHAVELSGMDHLLHLCGWDTRNDHQAVASVLKDSRQPESQYPQSQLAQGLSAFARMIAAGGAPRFFHISQSGFDTHAYQAQTHGQLLGDVSAAVSAFMADLRTCGKDGDVLVMIFSEFGRRVRENSSAGTDHGAAGVLMLAGAKVRGGLYGQQPSLTDLDNGDLKHTVDFRDCYATILENWLGVPAEPVIGQRHQQMTFI